MRSIDRACHPGIPFAPVEPNLLMTKYLRMFAALLAVTAGAALTPCRAVADATPIGAPGMQATYRLVSSSPPRSNVVERVTLQLGSIEPPDAGYQWLALHATKANGQRFDVWILSGAYPAPDLKAASAKTLRYILQEGNEAPQEFVHRFTHAAVLPSVGGWSAAWPRPAAGNTGNVWSAQQIDWLGHRYQLESTRENVPFSAPQNIQRLELLPDVLVGVPSNRRTKDDTRRFDESDYEMVRLTRENYAEMIRAGLNCFSVDREQAGWLRNEPVFYWGIGGADVAFPECLYRPTYLGPALFLDEPAVGTRDSDLRPRLAKEADFRRAITPQIAMEQYRKHYHHTVTEGAPAALMKSLQARADIDLGNLVLWQANVYSWETMVAAAAWELTIEPEHGPRAFVFEPPGRLGSRRTLPEMNMSYGCQLAPDDPANFAGILFGFLRGGARAADKDWGLSIYGAVDRADAPWLLTHAYDSGATHFFFWDNYQLACVPYSEYLALARHLQAHAQSHPQRNLARLKQAAEVAILLPPGYDLGHTHMGRGNLWGLDELNLERTNRCGVSYRRVMGNCFTEIERCLRQGTAFDLSWDLEGRSWPNYREVIHVREDGRVEVVTGSRRSMLKTARVPERSTGRPPQLSVDLTARPENPHSFRAHAQVVEGDAPVFLTGGADRHGIYHNLLVLWELYGPMPEDYHAFSSRVVTAPDGPAHPGIAETQFKVNQPGHYRLRAATTDLAGRSTVVWKEIQIKGVKP